MSYDILNAGLIRVSLGDALQLNESCQDSLNRYRVGALPAGPYRAQGPGATVISGPACAAERDGNPTQYGNCDRAGNWRGNWTAAESDGSCTLPDAQLNGGRMQAAGQFVVRLKYQALGPEFAKPLHFLAL